MTRARGRHPWLIFTGGIGLAVALVVPAATVVAAQPSAPSPVRPGGLAPAVPAGAARVGDLAPTQALAFAVVLPPSHPTELAALMHDLYDPASPRYERWLAPGEFEKRFGPTAASVGAVVDWLHGAGLPDTRLVDGRVEVRAVAGAAARAFGVSFARYRLAGGQEQFAATQAPLVPRALANDVAAIVGLSGVAPRQPHLKVLAHLGGTQTATPHAGSCSKSIEQQANDLDGWSTRQTGLRYDVDRLQRAGLRGVGKTVALYELAPHTESDVATYLQCFGLHNPVTTVAVDGGSPETNPGAILEANLDIEAAAVTAPGATLVSYEGPNGSEATPLGPLHVWSAIVNDDTAQLISTSWGLCEPLESASERKATHALFVQAAAQGQTIFSAAGDAGSEDCLFQTGRPTLAVDSPASDPLVTGVGGTSLFRRSSATVPFREPVWNDCQTATGPNCSFGGAAGGGGKSTVYQRPSWQPANACAGCRGVPDISANAGIGEAFESAGHWSLVGGTSIAAPRLAGIAADVAGGCISPLGSFNPRLYAIAKQGGYGFALRDIGAGQGDNDLTRTNGGKYPTGKGYDLATGLGTPLATGLACPEVARVRPAQAAAGSRVTIDGLALAHATVTFGPTAAQIVKRSNTSATVVVPAGSGTVVIRAAGAMGHGTYHASFTYG
jgi:subtilase family serine protease